MSFKVKLRDQKKKNVSNYCCCLGAKLCLTLCDPMNCNMPGFPFLLCLFSVGKFIKQISYILKNFFFYFEVISDLHKSWGKKTVQKVHIYLYPVCLQRSCKYTSSPQTFNWHPSMNLPYNSYVCLMMTFPFFIPSVFVNWDASVGSSSVSSAFFFTVKEKAAMEENHYS